ncbi:hypothetical protein QP128_01575 [Klebsiella aerogenes]|nr:hypothetical protein [Klebsiella aerogenes]MDK6456426.1 hypothetical protein [Klebsiella aerogenes]
MNLWAFIPLLVAFAFYLLGPYFGYTAVQSLGYLSLVYTLAGFGVVKGKFQLAKIGKQTIDVFTCTSIAVSLSAIGLGVYTRTIDQHDTLVYLIIIFMFIWLVVKEYKNKKAP